MYNTLYSAPNKCLRILAHHHESAGYLLSSMKRLLRGWLEKQILSNRLFLWNTSRFLLPSIHHQILFSLLSRFIRISHLPGSP